MSEAKESEVAADGEGETLAERGNHIARNMAEVFDVSSQIWSPP